MKKLLLCALLCAGILNSMEVEQPNYWNLLPREVQVIVIQDLSSGDTLNKVIRDIKSLSLANKELNAIINNKEIFKALVHVLVEKFKSYTVNYTPYGIAHEFKTPAAKEYMQLYNTLKDAMHRNDIEGFKTAIKEGADTNAQASLLRPYLSTSLSNVPYPTYAMTQLLLKYANYDDISYGLKRLKENAPEYEQIKKLLENALFEKLSGITKKRE